MNVVESSAANKQMSKANWTEVRFGMRARRDVGYIALCARFA